MDNSETTAYESDEVEALFTNKVVFSIAPTFRPAARTDPYKMLDHSGSSMQLRLRAYTDGNKKPAAVFNLTLPDYVLLYDVVRNAQCFNIGAWNLAERIDGFGTEYMSRIFGKPMPPGDPHEGLCRVRIMTLKRDPVMRDGSIARLPWFIEIKNGYGEMITREGGSQSMRSNTFSEDIRYSCRLSDGQMHRALYWGNMCINVMSGRTYQGIIRAAMNKLKNKRYA